MSFDEIKGVVSEVFQMLRDWSELYNISFSPSFNVTGGEPCLRPDFYEILILIKDIGAKAYILSNGTLIDREKARLLKNLDVSGVQISIEGPQEIHDSLRGKESFLSSLNGIRQLVDAGIMVTLNTTLSKVNAPYLVEVKKLAHELGAQRFGFSRLVPYGIGSSLLDKMLLKEEVSTLYHNMFDESINSLEVVSGDPLVSQMYDDKPSGGNIALGGCAAGISGLTILPDGTITPCRRMPIAIGNIRVDSLREIWATSSVLEALRNRALYKGKCGACDRWSTCRGCRAIAYAYSKSTGNGDFLAEDPQCFICK